MPRDARKVGKGLIRKGFLESTSHHRFYIYYTCSGKKSSVQTKMSHSATDISDPLLCKMARDVKLTKEEFLSLVDCPLSREAYELKLIALSVIKPV